MRARHPVCSYVVCAVNTPDRLKEAGLEGAAVDFLSVDVEGVELMVRSCGTLALHAVTSQPCHRLGVEVD